MSKKNISKTIWILLPLILIFAIFFIFQINSKYEKESKAYVEQYWKQNVIEFCGIVENKKHIERGFGYICLEKTFSNLSINDSLYVNNEVFIYKILGDKILLVSEVASLKIGDSLCFNIDQNKAEIRYRNGKIFKSIENSVIYKTETIFSPRTFNCF